MKIKTNTSFLGEKGGIRGWLCTNLAEFTRRMTMCWSVDYRENRRISKVPMLPQLSLKLKGTCQKLFSPVLTRLKGGVVNDAWVDAYETRPDEGDNWRMTANSLLWLQIMLLDTWLAENVDILMGAVPREVVVPATPAEAKECAENALKCPQDSTAWNPARMRFVRLWLRKLVKGSAGGEGMSYLSTGRQIPEKDRWLNMRDGSDPGVLEDKERWRLTDAVLTLRAVLMYVRLKQMNDSSKLLELRKFDVGSSF